ncbi:MAG: hypothetical protein C0459_04495 [Chitinophaga sp.]|jgi:glycosyltransferase involved in cell wall biosynthesis|nr:hypothetical protein [Chitinophaga sp.]
MELLVINSHPIQYFAPLYRQITADSNIQLNVLYCSDTGIEAQMDKGFGVKLAWDIPLLQGYPYHFLKNYSGKPSVNSFWGLINPGIIRFLFTNQKKYIWVHGWNSFTNVLVIIVGRLCGHKICLRAETPWNQELLKPSKLTALKQFYLKLLFLNVHYFFYIGSQNKLFYQQLHIAEKKMVFVPYSVDNAFFTNAGLNSNKQKLSEHFVWYNGRKVILYSGKYIAKKNPLDLIEAFALLKRNNCVLVMVGEGELREQMQKKIEDYGMAGNIILTGFINQSQIPLYYAAADVFVMCSGLGETWGLSVNEAMNFGTPVVVSNVCGCGFDLVKSNENGFVFEEGNIEDLATCISKCLSFNDEKRKSVAKLNKSILKKYSYETIIHSLENCLN